MSTELLSVIKSLQADLQAAEDWAESQGAIIRKQAATVEELEAETRKLRGDLFNARRNYTEEVQRSNALETRLKSMVPQRVLVPPETIGEQGNE